MLPAVYHARNGNPNRAYQIFFNLTQDARVPRQTLAFSYHALILFGPSPSMSQINLDHCRAVAQTLTNEKVRDSLNTTLDRLQLKVNVMKAELLSNMEEEEASSTTIKQEEQSSDVNEMKRADETDGPARPELDGGTSSSPGLEADIEAEVSLVAD